MNEFPRPQTFPSTIYKYRDWGCNFHQRVLSHRELYFPSPDKLNDPFDMNLRFRYDLIPSDKRFDYFRSLPIPGEENLTDDEKDKLVRKRIDEVVLKPIPAHNQKFDQCSLFEAFGVYSTSRKWDDIVMWSHYANSHTGFCVGFNSFSLNEAFDSLLDNDLICDIQNVIYSDDINIYPEKEDRIQQFERLLVTKYTRWKYEDEVRLLLYSGGEIHKLTEQERLVVIPESAVSEVILGYRMPPHHRDQIKVALRAFKDRPQLFSIETKLEEFGLFKREIHY